MVLKNWFLGKKLWLRGGIIGVVICLLLGLFHIFIYSPIISTAFKDGFLPSWIIILPLISGYILPIFLPYVIPPSWMCKYTEPHCLNWNGVYNSSDSIMPQEPYGYCINEIMQPTSSCYQLSDTIEFYGILFLLFVIYFLIGALVGHIIQKKKNKIKKN